MATVEQMCRQNGPHWIIAQDGEPELRAMYERHYSCYHYKDGRRPKKFCGPGQIIPLTLPNRDALFVWRKFKDDSGQTGINCAVFRNESHYLSSDLIREADAIADFCWPCERHYTYVRAEAIQSRNPGYCFLCAGWKHCGYTKAGLFILERKERKMKEGDKVDYHAVIGGPVTSTGHVVEYIHRAPNDFGQDVAWISGKSGCVALSALTPAQKEFGG